ncbi:lipopolysaccharide assembly protein LapA domain-containing protein [Pseudomonas fluorescens]|uniref:lipopolysaccharide assembly protein LapA domain-containing protein n=1 Tax=Pseudomonas fluorescens TaxID=294 RepID=UPI0012B7D718|nr:lipopolysaccharide assembly protein LapA domain-containing protein [Pseudomonas fluorescens]
MKTLLRWFLFLIVLSVILAVVVFVLENQQSVIITFAGWSSVEVSVSSCLIVALLVGMAIGPVLGFALRYRRGVRSARKFS